MTISTETTGATIHYTTNGDTPTTSSSTYSSAITINNDMTIKAIAVKNGYINSEVASATYTVINYTPLPFSWQGGSGTELTALTGVTGYSLGDYAESNAPYRVQMNATGDYILIKTDSTPGTVYFAVKMIGGGTTSKIKVQESANGSDFTDVEELTVSGKQNDILNLVSSTAFKEATRYVRLYKSVHASGGNIGIGPITITKGVSGSSSGKAISLSATLNNGRYWASFYNGTTRYTLPEGAEAYIMDSTGRLYRLGDTGREIPKGIAVIIISDSDTVILEESTSNSEVSTHDVTLKLTGSNFATTVSSITAKSETPYVLGAKNGVLGFYEFNGTAIPAMKAYYTVK